ncbi:GTP-binding protein Era [hydrothermal vent metagenome]|uniref:GTP-binding protein Era n=1 Tax=hydrothermal vent metagenome TaxID=652676 RepID=A0A3B1BBD7_9ZZZZ
MNKDKIENDFRCGYVALVGRPNMGKSTLLNHLLGQKLSITSRKPQTTRQHLLGIKTTKTEQIIYVDTPGIHENAKRAINRYMNRTAFSALDSVNVIVFLVEALKWTSEDEMVLKRIKDSDIPAVLAINKVDKIDDKNKLLPYIQELSTKMDFLEVMPISATKGINLSQLEACVREQLEVSEAFYPEDQITDRSQRFLAAELVREKLMRMLGQELPYDLTVEIEKFKEEKGRYHIHALIWVERKNQKAIVIGEKGSRLKNVGTQARQDMEKLFNKKVFLEIWVKVKEGWSDDERALQSLGYKDEL